MPNHLKFILSIVIVLVAIAVSYWQGRVGQNLTPWVALALGAFMIFAIWLFPEAGGGKKGQGE